MTPLEPKIDFKGKFAPFQNCEMWAKFSGLNPKGSYLSLEKEKETFCVVFTCSAKRAREIRKFHVAVVQRWPKNAQKSVMHVQSCCFTNINLLLCLPFSLPSPSLLPKLSFVVIQKFCYHGNVTSHFTSLLVLSNSRRSIWPTDQKLVMVSAPYIYYISAVEPESELRPKMALKYRKIPKISPLK